MKAWSTLILEAKRITGEAIVPRVEKEEKGTEGGISAMGMNSPVEDLQNAWRVGSSSSSENWKKRARSKMRKLLRVSQHQEICDEVARSLRKRPEHDVLRAWGTHLHQCHVFSSPSPLPSFHPFVATLIKDALLPLSPRTQLIFTVTQRLQYSGLNYTLAFVDSPLHQVRSLSG